MRSWTFGLLLLLPFTAQAQYVDPNAKWIGPKLIPSVPPSVSYEEQQRIEAKCRKEYPNHLENAVWACQKRAYDRFTGEGIYLGPLGSPPPVRP